MSVKPIRVGIIGAGANTRARHIPGLRAIEGVQVTAVVNRTPESTARAARELQIPKTFPDWKSLVQSSEIDAVCIGTWPNMHCELTCAALAAGKHVLCEARMARNAEEAHRMLRASQARPDLVAQIVPSPFGLTYDAFVRQIIQEGYLGMLREVVVIGTDDMFWDDTKLMHWRQSADLSGLNVMAMGILHETLCRWVPETTRVFAQSQIFEPTRPSATQASVREAVTVPESLQIVTQLANGARGLYHMSSIELFGPGKQIHLYGRSGTIKYLITPEEKLLVGRAGDSQLTVVDLPAEKRGGWRVEAEFIGAIRGTEKVAYTDFVSGVKYMEFTEAVARSAALNQTINLPLEAFA